MVHTHTAGLKSYGVAFGMLCGLTGAAWAADDALPASPVVAGAHAELASDAAAPLFDFDIPAQPLNAALNQYADVSGQPALFPSDVVNARASTAVRGRYPAEAALHILLQGTGLIADKRSSGLGQTFVLKDAGTASTASGNGMAELFSADGFSGLVQMRVWQALCANALTRPGNYSSLLRFYLEADGRVRGARLIGTSGDPRRDAALLDILRGISIDRAPPAGIVRRPVTMIVAPNPPDTGPQCSLAREAS